jgi:hypothetical protein
MDVRQMGRDSMDWIHLDHDSDQWNALVNVDSIKCREILNTRATGASQEGLSAPWS